MNMPQDYGERKLKNGLFKMEHVPSEEIMVDICMEGLPKPKHFYWWGWQDLMITMNALWGKGLEPKILKLAIRVRRRTSPMRKPEEAL